MIETYRLIWKLLDRRERRGFVILILLTIGMGVFEMIGVAAILPFLSLLNDPSLIETNRVVRTFAALTGQEDPQQVTFLFGIGVLVLLVLGTLVRAAGTYAQIRYTTMRAYSIATRLLRAYLHQPYPFYLQRNSSEIALSLLSEVDVVVRQSLTPAVMLISFGTVSALIAGLLIAVAPVVAISAALALATVYGGVYLLVRRPIDRIGQQRIKFNSRRFRVVQEAGAGIKEVKVMGLEPTFMKRFRDPSYGLARAQAWSQMFGRMPRFVLEAMIYGGFVTMILVLMVRREGNLQELLPLLGLLGLASVKIFPAVQQIYKQISQMRFSIPALRRLDSSIAEMTSKPMNVALTADVVPPLPLIERLSLRYLQFAYPSADRPALDGVTLDIPARSTLGIVGGTGAGKTTVVDLILGLLSPDAGGLLVDGVEITEANRTAWQRNIGYVPQSIFLADDTVAANIAFGLPHEEIDHAAVERAARIANLHDFVLANLPEGYETAVGERGVRLSGGQRQRIGIARALYHDPDVLILDEATSALDNLTERAVMDAVHNLGGNKTVVMIAHRLSTVQTCDKIVMLRNGRIVAEGSYEALMETSDEFREMANA